MQSLPLTREVDSPKAKTEGETEKHELPVYLSLSLAALDSLRPWSQSQIAPRFGYKQPTGLFA